MNPIVFLVISTVLSMLFIPLAVRLAPRMGMLDEPDARKVHAKVIPRIGGFGITLGALIPLALMLDFDRLMVSFLIGSATMFFFGMWDDAQELSHWVKFPGQFFAAAVVVYYGDLWVERFPFMDGQPLPAEFGQPFTVFAIVGVINAINHSDGLDGLAGGESILSLILIGFLAYASENSFAVYICCAVAGGILGFLRYNTHPAQVFMGDAGSQFLGFAIAFLVVHLTQVAHTALSPALPLLLIGLPLADINAVFYLRISQGMNWFRATRNHIHHRLLDLGFDHYETVILIYSAQALLVSLAILLRYESDYLITAVYFGLVAAIFTGLTVAERAGWKAHRLGDAPGLSRVVGEMKAGGLLAQLPPRLVVLLVSAFMVGGAASVTTVPFEFAWIASGIAVLTLVHLAIGGTPGNTPLVRIAVYATLAFVANLSIKYPPASATLALAFSTPFFAVLVLSLALSIRLASEDTFRTTPTDYLIAFGIAAISLFGRELFEVQASSLLLIHSVVLFYAGEVSFRQGTRRWSLLNLATLLSLCILGARGLALNG